ncbi:MAG: protein kinase [Myxococcales bacterium]|nr:protein kinase [Myxococcales bacterium]MCB9627772.1 protein kinase [Sandaracinaceae bacterium]
MLIADRYRIEEKLVEDALGQLFRAHDLRHDRPVSVRLLSFENAERPRVKRERWAREARILGASRHPGLMAVYDLDEHHEPPFCVLEPLEGEPFASWMARGQIPKLEVWHNWMQRLLGALGEVHRQGFLHRNLGPEYLFLTERGGLKLLGLGGARTARDSTLSTYTITAGVIPRYGAPELIETRFADARADLYSAGALGFRMLTGVDAIPIDESRPMGEAIQLVLRGTPYRASQLRPDVGLPYDNFFERMLSVDPAQRPASAEEAAALLKSLSQLPTGAGRSDDVRMVRDEEASARSSAPKLGDTIAGARVIGKLGAGGMGAVLLGRDDKAQRNVALKILGAVQRGDRERALLAEARALTLFSHANVVRIFGVGEHHGQPVIVMEYVAGKTVEEYLLARQEPAPVALTVSVLSQVATGLAAVHARGLVHADVKAANVLIGPAGRVCVADFGLATAAEAFRPGPVAHVAGTPEYLAPERATGALHAALAPRVDVYSLAVMAFEMLTYRRLYATDDSAAQIEAHVSAPTPRLRTFRPDLPVELEEVLARALEKDPSRRTASCLAFRTELLAAAERMLPPLHPGSSPIHLLLVTEDDVLEALVRDGLGDALSAHLTRATDVADARAHLTREVPATLVLLDHELPGAGAVELSAWMHASLDTTPTLLAIAREDSHPDWQMLQAVGIREVVLSPLAPDVLRYSVRRLLTEALRDGAAVASGGAA